MRYGNRCMQKQENYNTQTYAKAADDMVTNFATPGRSGSDFFSIRAKNNSVFRLWSEITNAFLSSSLFGAFSGQPVLLK